MMTFTIKPERVGLRRQLRRWFVTFRLRGRGNIRLVRYGDDGFATRQDAKLFGQLVCMIANNPKR
jgi:hypothetical protein